MENTTVEALYQADCKAAEWMRAEGDISTTNSLQHDELDLWYVSS